MIRVSPRRIRHSLGMLCCLAACIVAPVAGAPPQAPAESSPAESPAQTPPSNTGATPQQPSGTITQQSRQTGEPIPIPRQEAPAPPALGGLVRDAGFSNVAIPVPGARVTLRDLQSGRIFASSASGEGVFRIFPVPPGH